MYILIGFQMDFEKNGSGFEKAGFELDVDLVDL